MTDLPTPDTHDTTLRRQRARRTAGWAGGVAALVYIAFILSGVIGR